MEKRLIREQKFIPLDDASQIGEVRREAQYIAQRTQLSDEQTAAFAIVASEAVANVFRHGGGLGAVSLRADHLCAELTVWDKGPGMSDPESCFQDGYSVAGTMGTGLGAIRRLSTHCDIYTRPGEGTVLVSRIGPHSELMGTYASVVSPAPGEHICGDAWSISQLSTEVAVTVVDGLGHGLGASQASVAAIEIFDQHASDAPAQIIERTHVALRPTRGAAVAVARTYNSELEFAGIGNISARLISSDRVQNLVSLTGTAGHYMRRIQPFRYNFSGQSLLVLHSDGIHANWDLRRYPALLEKDPAIVAALIYRDNLRGRDDATVVVVKLQPEVHAAPSAA